MRFYKRTLLLFFVFNILIAIIISYLFFLQIISHKYYFNRSIKNYTRFENIESIRGIITDENNIPIAITESQINIFWHHKPKKLTANDRLLKHFLEEILHININQIIEHSGSPHTKLILIKENISFEEYAMILEKFPHTKRIQFKQKLKRTYPHKNLFCHIVGYINKDKQSVYGLEKLYNDILIGKDGIKKNTVTAAGEVMSCLFITEPQSGHTIKTTLNFKIQSGLATCFPKEFSGCAIVINPLNGAIKGLYSHPTFNPEIFQNGISQAEWDEVIKNNSLINRVIQGQYAPGSIYKLLISLILLEENIIKDSTQWFCQGFIEYKNKKYHCNKKTGHGIVTIQDGIAHSCNIPFFINAISQHISVDTIAKYASTFNLGKKTNLFDNEKSGLIPTIFWKKKTYGLPWYTGENLSIFIGQGATTLTPLQMSQLIMGIMHGYVICPFIIETEKKEKKILPYKKENLMTIRNNMKLGTKIGSSKILASMTHWDIYAKTGTVQVCTLSKKKDDQESKTYDHHGIFTCWAKYKNNDPMIIVFVIENNNNSKHTVAVVKEFLLYCEENIYR
jgi:penicillin-binding protein 2